MCITKISAWSGSYSTPPIKKKENPDNKRQFMSLQRMTSDLMLVFKVKTITKQMEEKITQKQFWWYVYVKGDAQCFIL